MNVPSTTTFMDHVKANPPKTRRQLLGIGLYAPIPVLKDTLSCAFYVPLNAITFGQKPHLSKNARARIDAVQFIISLPMLFTLRALNPHAKYSKNVAPCRKIVQDKWLPFTQESTFTKSTFRKHLIGRIAPIPFALAFAAARITDFAISCILTPVAFLTYGKFETVNNLAISGSKIFGLAYDLYKCTASVFFPGTWSAAVPG